MRVHVRHVISLTVAALLAGSGAVLAGGGKYSSGAQEGSMGAESGGSAVSGEYSAGGQGAMGASGGSGSTMGTTASTGGQGSGKSNQARFDELDQDDSGYLTESEVEGVADLEGRWSAIDTDDDAQVDRSEFAAFELQETGEGDAGQQQSPGMSGGTTESGESMEEGAGSSKY